MKMMKKSNNFEKNRKNLKNHEKPENVQKVQKFSHSIWKVPKMFCHLERPETSATQPELFLEPFASFGIFILRFLKICLICC